ncbi:MAG TPA: OmpA family protein [Gemmatimonadaceae bacterium]|nr:OmpA family protein [Gemmatimonadaceae bacterium]
MRLRSYSHVWLVGVAALVSACRQPPPPPPTPQPEAPPVVQAPPVTQPVVQQPPPPPPPQPTGPTPEEIERAITTMKNTLTAAIYFDYDKSDLRDDARAILDAKVPLLQRFNQVRVRISGHTDDRGSDQYNMSLGQARAFAARRYLELRGVDPSRIDIVSFGEERPSAMGEGEESWSRNRRDEFEIVAGANQIRPTTE